MDNKRYIIYKFNSRHREVIIIADNLSYEESDKIILSLLIRESTHSLDEESFYTSTKDGWYVIDQRKLYEDRICEILNN